MQIEVSRVFKFDGAGSVKAMCDIVLEGQLAIKGFRIVSGKKGLFVSPPREQGKDGKWYDKICPLSNQMKQLLTETVLRAYDDKD